jgi:multiple sugar transport system permease protein
MALTGGGPGRGTEVLALYILKTIFTELNLGRGSAAAMLLLLINVAMTWVYFRFLNIGAA